MKRLLFYKVLLVIIAVVGLHSCKDIGDFHQGYLKDGETVYLVKMDSMQAYSGRNRVQISGYLRNAYNVSRVKVYWNEHRDSMIFNYKKEKDLDSLNLIIPNLAEKSYLFDVYTLNDIGNRSIKMSIAATSYGDFYQTTLYDRMLKNNCAYSTNGKITLDWLSPIDNSIGCELNYVNIKNENVRKIIKTESQTILSDVASGLKYRTLFIPEKSSIDTFYTSFNPIKVIEEEKLSNQGWKIIDFSSEEPAEGAPNGLASAAIDGDMSTFWISHWDGETPAYPHWFSVDLGEEVTISSFEGYRRMGNASGQTKIQLFYSSNGTDWNEYGTFEIDPSVEGQKYSIGVFPKARYIKYVALEGPDFYAFLAELDVYIAK